MKKLSIRTAILFPFLVVIITIIITFSIMMEKSYEILAIEQGNKIMTSMKEVAEDNLITLLKEPSLMNTLYASLINLNKYYVHDEHSMLEPVTLAILKDIKEKLPQVSTISYGDENKNFIAFRRNENDTYTLMVKDSLTDYYLNIYSGENRSTDILASYENYDPTIRPWYTPVVDNPETQWSEIYINMDEINNSTITSIIPIYNDNNDFVGVSGIDVNLNSINVFLKDIALNNKGTIYLLDESSRIIAHSTDEELLKLIDSDTLSAEYLHGRDSSNPIISSTALYFEENDIYDTVKVININNERFYMIKEKIDPSLGLKWSLVVVVSEKDLIGNITILFTDMRTTLSILAGIGLILGGIVISFFISSVTQMANKVQTITTSNLANIQFTNRKINFKEIDKLQNSYNSMLTELSKSFITINQSQKKYKSLIENSDALIFSMDTDGTMLTFNSLVNKYANIDNEALKNSSFFDFFPDDKDKLKWKEHLKESCLNKKPYSTIYEYFDNTNNRVVFKVKIIPITNKAGEVYQLIATFFNIVELVEAQEDIEKLMKTENIKLEKLVIERTQSLELAMEELIHKEKLASLGSLVSGISHEINTPLGVAVSASSYLKSIALKSKDKLLSGKLTKTEFIKFVDHLEDSVLIIENNLIRASDLIQSFKQISINKTYTENTTFNIHDYLDATLKSLHHETRIKGHEIILECPNNLNIYGNPGSFSQVITNLILNSIIHGFDEGVKGKISIKTHESNDWIVIEYNDNGKGIPKEIQSKVFDPFFTTNRKQGGSGLGLNIVYNIITGQFGGKIQVSSEIGLGTSFTIQLPKNHKEK